MEINDEYREYIINNEVSKIKKLLNQGWDPSVNNNDPLQTACAYNCKEIVKMLLQDKRVDINVDTCIPIIWASHYNNIEIVKLILENPRFKISELKENHNIKEVGKIIKLNRELKIKKLYEYRSQRI